MAKYYGIIGFVKTYEDPENPGVWKTEVHEDHYRGDVKRYAKRIAASGEKANSDVIVTNAISIIADPYAIENFQYIKYAEWMGTFWTVASVDVNRPRFELSLGGVYVRESEN